MFEFNLYDQLQDDIPGAFVPGDGCHDPGKISACAISGMVSCLRKDNHTYNLSE